MTQERSPIVRLLSQGGVYAIGNALLKLSGLFLAPLYLDTALLSGAEYGRFSLLDVTGSLAILLFGLGMGSALIKFLSDEQDGEVDSVPFTALMIVLISGAVAVVAFKLMDGAFSSWFLESSERSALIGWYGVYVGLQVVLVLPYGFVRYHERAGLYVVGRMLEMAILIGGVYVFLGRMRLGLDGIVYAYVLSSAVALLVMGGGMLSRIRWDWKPLVARRLLVYGAPLSVGLVAAPLLHAGDRYLIDWILGDEPLARYFWATRLSGVLNMFFVQSLSLAFAVIGIKALTKTDVDVSLHRRSFRHFVVIGSWIALALAVLAPNLTAILTDEPQYVSAANLVFPLSLGYLFYGGYLIVVNALYAAGSTRYIAWSVVAATVANALLNWWLLQVMGVYGAAIATVAAYALLMLLTVVEARRHFRINYSWTAMAGAIVVATTLYVLDALASGTDQPHWWSHLGFRLVLLLIFPVGIVALRLYRLSEVRHGWDVVQRRLRRRRRG
ncbi:MAG: oligosaccharide flippase family protein [Rhodothermales bacterium]